MIDDLLLPSIDLAIYWTRTQLIGVSLLKPLETAIDSIKAALFGLDQHLIQTHKPFLYVSHHDFALSLEFSPRLALESIAGCFGYQRLLRLQQV